MKAKAPINWVNTLFLIISPIVAIGGTLALLLFGHIATATWIFAAVMLLVTGLAVTAGYHRLFSHRSFKAHWSVRLLFALLGAATFEGSVLEWSTDHRNHHRYTDTDKDPYDINKGFWYAHMGWLIRLDISKRDFSNVEDLASDPILRWQHKYYVVLAIIMSFILPMAIAALWGNILGGFVVAGALRIVVNHHATFCINSVCHIYGKKTYSEKQSARDNWVTALFTYGEGFHNFHHQFPIDYRNGLRFFHFDPTKWLVYGLSKIGLVNELKRVSQSRIVRYRVQNDTQNFMLRAQNYSERAVDHMHNAVQSLHERIMQLSTQLDELEKSYAKFKKEGLTQMQGKIEDYRKHLSAYRIDMRKTRAQLRYAMSSWSLLMRKPTRIAN